jgi:hypothetical protein
MKEALVALAGSALPTLMVLVGILLSRNDINRLDGRVTALETSQRADMTSLRGELRGDISSLRSEMRGEMGSLRGEMNAMRDRFHSDMMMLMSSNASLDARVSKLEEKSENN